MAIYVRSAGVLQPLASLKLPVDAAFADAINNGTDTPAALAASIAAASPNVYFNGAHYTDGAFPATGRLESGHEYVVTHSGASGFAIANGGLQADSSLAYLNLGPLPGEVTLLEVDAVWTNDGQAADQAVVVILANGPFANNYPSSVYADAAAHLLFYSNRWVFQKRKGDGTATTTVASFDYVASPVADAVPYGTPATFRLARVGNSFHVTRHDGGVTEIPLDADMLAWSGEYACIEVVAAHPGNNRVTVKDFSVSSIPRTSFGANVLAPAARAQGSTIIAPGTTSVALVPTYTTVFTKQVIVPASKALVVTASVPVTSASDGNLSGSITLEGNPTATISQALLEAQVHNGLITWTVVLDLADFAVGQSKQLRVRLAHSGTGTYRTATSGPPRLPTVVAHEARGAWV